MAGAECVLPMETLMEVRSLCLNSKQLKRSAHCCQVGRSYFSVFLASTLPCCLSRPWHPVCKEKKHEIIDVSTSVVADRPVRRGTHFVEHPVYRRTRSSSKLTEVVWIVLGWKTRVFKRGLASISTLYAEKMLIPIWLCVLHTRTDTEYVGWNQKHTEHEGALFGSTGNETRVLNVLDQLTWISRAGQ